MKIEESTKRFWACCMVAMLFMVVSFFIYIDPHYCGGWQDCKHFTLPNGTIREVPVGELAIAAPSLQPMLFFDLFTGAGVFVILAYSVAKQALNNERRSVRTE